MPNETIPMRDESAIGSPSIAAFCRQVAQIGDTPPKVNRRLKHKAGLRLERLEHGRRRIEEGPFSPSIARPNEESRPSAAALSHDADQASAVFQLPQKGFGTHPERAVHQDG